MAESASAAPRAASIPSSADIARAEKLVRERFLHEGEDPSQALAPGTPRREALDMALGELEEDPEMSSTATYTLSSSHFVSTTFVSSTGPITIRLSFPTTSHSGAGRTMNRFHGVAFWLGIVSALIIVGGLI